MPRRAAAPTLAVAYYRVSTARQGQSGLGLEAQRAAVLAFAQGRGLTVGAEFQEVETATRKGRRPRLAAALEHCRRTGATLLIARLDRLARSVSFVSALMDAGVPFVAVDMPDADRLTLHVVAAVAEKEAQLISERTRAALAARKARGLRLGTPANLTPAARAAGAASVRAAAVAASRPATAHAATLRRQGQSLRQIACALDAAGFSTRAGGPWHVEQVRRLLLRAS